MWRQYYTVTSIDEAAQLLAEHPGSSRIIAGGTDLILEIESGQRHGLDTLIDVSRIDGLDQIQLDNDGWVHMGPLVTHNHVAKSPLIIERAHALARACWEVGAPQIRNRGTLAGNLITASPANDSITPLTALAAHVRLRSVHGERVVPLDQFHVGVRQTAIESDEILVDIAFPLPSLNTRSAFYKLGLRRAQAISVINVAVVLTMDHDVVQAARITLGSVAPSIVRAYDAEAYLAGRHLTGETVSQAGELATRAARPIDDIRSTAEYRQEMVRVFTKRALQSLAEGNERMGYPRRPVTLGGPGEYHHLRELPRALCHTRGTPIRTTINGQRYCVETGHNKTLLRFLREDVGLTGTKEGCSEGECGACTLLLDGMAVMSCLVPAPRAHDAEIVTVEGLADGDDLHPIQEAFAREGAVQCGYCTPGLLMAGAKLLDEIPDPSRHEIQQAIAGNLCRCVGYYKIISAIEQAASMLRSHRSTCSSETDMLR